MPKPIPAVSVAYAQNGSSTLVNAFGMRPMQERAFERRGEQYLLIKSPPALNRPTKAISVKSNWGGGAS